MKHFITPRVVAGFGLVLFVFVWWAPVVAMLPDTSRQAAATIGRGSSGRLTIDALIDIKHPSAPVWSRDSRRVAFLWDRAGVTNLYVTMADGSGAPVGITNDGRGATGVFWSADSRDLFFNRGGTLMRVSADGGTPQPAFATPLSFQGTNLVVSPDGTRAAYVKTDAGVTRREIRVRSLVDGSDQLAATFDGGVTGLAWAHGNHLTFTSGGTAGQSLCKSLSEIPLI